MNFHELDVELVVADEVGTALDYLFARAPRSTVSFRDCPNYANFAMCEPAEGKKPAYSYTKLVRDDRYGIPSLVLDWYLGLTPRAFRTDTTLADVKDFVRHWLHQVTRTSDSGLVYADAWGHVGGLPSTIIVIQPA
jgi:hypothetical protein